MKPLLYILLISIIPLSVFSQNSIRVSGVVKDQKTKLTLEYAHVGIQDKGIGTVTNSRGEFSLLIPDGSLELTVSYIGYETTELNLSNSGLTNFEILLKPRAINLPELVISNKQRNIIEEAVEAIPFNHDLGDMKIRGFWRAQIENRDTIIQLSETVFDIFRLGDNTNNDLKKTSEMAILKGRISRDSARFDSLRNFQAGATPRGIFSSSFLVSSNFLSKKTIKKHHYEIVDVVEYDGMNVFIVEFNKKESEKIGYQGQIYLEVETLAFIKIISNFSAENEEDINLFQKKRLSGRVSRLYKSTWDTNQTELQFQKVNGKWYLSHGKYEADWTLIDENETLVEPVSYSANFVITEIKKGDYIVPPKKEFAKAQILEHQVDYEKEDFWKDYNILEPDQDFEKVFKEITERNLEYSSRKADSESIKQKRP